MLNFTNLHILFKHLHFVHTTLESTDVFFVWWAVRDVLLGRTDDPMDIDCTMAGHPEQIWDGMSFDEMLASRFRTEKFGTMTLLPKYATHNTLEPIAIPPDETDVPSPPYEYEITPFRTEWTYTDVRHPDDIQRSNDLLADSARRDFTINCLYRYGAICDTQNLLLSDKEVEGDIGNLLQTHKNLYIPSTHTLILQDHTTISSLYAWWVLQSDLLAETIRTTPRVQDETQDTSDEIQDSSLETKVSILIDPHGGILDLLQGKIQTVGTPDNRFTEDALRIIRGVRFANILNQQQGSREDKSDLASSSLSENTITFDFEKNTRLAMQTHAQLVSQLSGERIHAELKKVFSANNPFGYVSILHELQLLPIIFPAVAATIGNHQPTRHHSLDTFHHTLMVLKEWQQLFGEEYLPLIALLYHDVGKPKQYEKMWEAIAANPEKPDRSTYEYHTESWAKLAQQDLQKLCFSKKEIEEVMRYIRRHHRPGEILDGKPDKRPVRIRKLMSDGGYTKTKNLLKIVIADRLGQHNPLQSPQLDEIHQLDALLDQLYNDEWRFTLAQMDISGNDLITELDITPGPELGMLLERAFDRVIWDVNERNEKEKILGFLKNL